MQASATNAPLAPHAGRSAPYEALVLIVDDYQDCREMYAAYLTLAGFRVVKAANGLDALAVARRDIPDLILMDLGMPGIDGCETTRRLKQDPLTSAIPVVALTAQSVPDDQTLRADGFESVITKPCRPDDLAQWVAQTVGRATS